MPGEKSMFTRLSHLKADTYIIAEVGQNHQGQVDIALNYISVFAALGANAVKFQMRDNKLLFDHTVYNQVYNSQNSFGATYGEHREFLELSLDDFITLRNRCLEVGVDFVVTPFDSNSLNVCVDIGVDALKIASFDLGNIPFLHEAARTRIPIIISTGGGTPDHIRWSVDVLKSYHNDIALLHCVSKYPCPINEVQLSRVKLLIEEYPDLTIGLSDHFNGILTGPIAYMVGARVFEKHVTFDRSLKGTDHPFSLEPEGFSKFVRDIKRTPLLCELNPQSRLGREPVFEKLGKSVAAKRSIKSGQVIDSSDIVGKVCRPNLISIRDSTLLIGKKAVTNIAEGEFLKWEDVAP